MSTHPLNKIWLTAELLRVKSGYADWARHPKTIWPQWSWERLGALADRLATHLPVLLALPRCHAACTSAQQQV